MGRYVSAYTLHTLIDFFFRPINFVGAVRIWKYCLVILKQSSEWKAKPSIRDLPNRQSTSPRPKNKIITMPLVCVCVTVVIINAALVAATRFTYLIFLATTTNNYRVTGVRARPALRIRRHYEENSTRSWPWSARVYPTRRGRFSPFPFSVVFPAFPWRARGYATRSDALRFFHSLFSLSRLSQRAFPRRHTGKQCNTLHTPPPLDGSAGHVFVSPNANVRWVKRGGYATLAPPLTVFVIKRKTYGFTEKNRKSRPRYGRVGVR